MAESESNCNFNGSSEDMGVRECGALSGAGCWINRRTGEERRNFHGRVIPSTLLTSKFICIVSLDLYPVP